MNSLDDFLTLLEQKKLLKKITHPLSPKLEITEVCHRVLKQQGEALLFTNPTTGKYPLLGNLYGTVERVALAMGANNTAELKKIGQLLAFLKEPEPPTGFKQALSNLPKFKKVLKMSPKIIKNPVCQQQIYDEKEVDLANYPIMTCWPDDVAPLLTWGLTITQSPLQKRTNLGIYRMQVIDKNKLIMRWLPFRGGAMDYMTWCKKNPKKPYPVAVAIGADPATTLAAVTPIPDSLGEYAFAGLLRNQKTQISKALLSDLYVPSTAQIILEGFIYPNEVACEGPFGDHTGYYNETQNFPVFTVKSITQKNNPIYHSTYTGRPPDEPAILGAALNEVFVPILQKQFPEIVDFYLPPEACSYRMAIVSIKKTYGGHPKRIAFGIWSYLRQFMFTKFIIVVDDDINIRDWQDVIWAISTRVDPARDSLIVDNTPIDYLDFASPQTGLGSKMMIDATNKLPNETLREWGKKIVQDKKVVDKIDKLWSEIF